MYAFSPHETMHLQKIIAQVIKLKAQYPEHQIQSIRMDNATKFSLMPSMTIVWP
jgi:hypothetical protein